MVEPYTLLEKVCSAEHRHKHHDAPDVAAELHSFYLELSQLFMLHVPHKFYKFGNKCGESQEPFDANEHPCMCTNY